MKKITLQIGLTMAMFILTGAVFSQTAVANLVRLTSLNPAGGGTNSSSSIISEDDSTITIDAAGAVTVGSDYTPTSATGNTTGTIVSGARSKTITVRLNTGSTVDLTPGATFGAITSAPGVGGMQRASDGGIGVTTTAGVSSGIDNGEGLTFGLDVSSLPSTLSVEISAVYFSTFGTAESCTVVNRQDASKSLTVTGFGTNAGTRDISGLGILIQGGTVGFIDAVSFFSPDIASSFRITGIEFKIVQPVNNLIILNSLTGTTTITPNGTTSTQTPLSIVSQDDSNISVSASGVVTIESDYARTASQTISGTTFTTGSVQIGGARNKTFSVRLSAGSVIDQTAGPSLGVISTTAGMSRAGDGGIGVTTNGASSGIDNGEGVNFGFDLSSLPSTVALQITSVYLSTFATAETCTVVNRQDTSKNVALAGFSGNAGNRDISALDIIIPGGTVDLDAVSFFNNSAAAQNFRITGIECKIVALSTLWNGTTWSNGNPGPAVDAIVEGNYSALAKGGFSAKTLTVNSGSLTIEATKNLKIENGVVNNAGVLGIVVEDGGTLQQVQEVGINSGAITVKKNSNLLKRQDYTMWSSPVVGSQTLADFSPLTSQSPNRFYIYDNTLGTNGLYDNIAPASLFTTGTGYLIRMPNEDPAIPGTSSDYYLGTSTIAFNGEFVGVPNNGTITLGSIIPLTSDKFYAVGNPYPSNISADLFLNGNSTGGTLYFWRKTNAAPGTAYATYTLLGGVGTDAGNGGLGLPNGIIAPCQGFIVKTDVAATTLTFTNAMRLQNATYGKFFKVKQEASKDRLWLNLTNATGAFSQALVGYTDGATVGVDKGIDGEYINDSKVALTSNINNVDYTIQGRPAFDAADVVALNFKTDVAGEYTIALDHFDGIFATGQAVYLLDSKTGSETDLKAGGYNFTAAVGIDNSRFTLKYQKTLKVIDSDFNDNNVTVYAKNGTLYVNSGASAISNIKVFDIQGRLVSEQKNVKSNTATISNLGLNQALIVQVSTEDNKVVSKKVVN
jgi:hypothetical protein